MALKFKYNSITCAPCKVLLCHLLCVFTISFSLANINYSSIPIISGIFYYYLSVVRALKLMNDFVHSNQPSMVLLGILFYCRVIFFVP